MATNSLPVYDVEDVAYLRESAALGFLEAVRITGVYKQDLGWTYTFASGAPRQPTPGTYGDRRSMVTRHALHLTEDELVSEAEAIRLAEANALAQYRRMVRLRESRCPS